MKRLVPKKISQTIRPTTCLTLYSSVMILVEYIIIYMGGIKTAPYIYFYHTYATINLLAYILYTVIYMLSFTCFH